MTSHPLTLQNEINFQKNNLCLRLNHKSKFFAAAHENVVENLCSNMKKKFKLEQIKREVYLYVVWWWIWKLIYFLSHFPGRLKYLTLTEANRVWMPDLFFSNEKEGHFHNIIMPNVYIRIFPYGSVLYSIRISLTLACPMNLKLYPLDRQICSLRMASCEYRNLYRVRKS